MKSFALILLLLTGCAALNRQHPLQDTYREYLYTQVRPEMLTDNQITTKKIRNTRINQLLVLLDDDYDRFEESLYEEDSTWGFITDVAIMALSGGSSLAVDTAVKTATAAASAAIVGTRAAARSNFYASATRYTVIAWMRTQRIKDRSDIENCKREPISVCPMSEALIYLNRYAVAGSLVSATQGLAEKVTENLNNAQQNLKVIEAKPISDDE